MSKGVISGLSRSMEGTGGWPMSGALFASGFVGFMYILCILYIYNAYNYIYIYTGHIHTYIHYMSYLLVYAYVI